MKVSASVVSTFLLVLLFTISVPAQTTEFTYQGSLKNGANPASGNYDFEFALFDAVSGGAQIGATLSRSSVAVTEGNFSVKLDFGSQFPGANRFLEIHVRSAGGGAFTPLAPRQSVGSSPYAVQSVRATSAATADTVSAGSISGVLTPSQGGTGIGPSLPPAGPYLRSNGLGWELSGLTGNGSALTNLNGANVTGTVANALSATTANTATTAGNVTGVVQIANGGTGSATKNFVDLTTDQAVAGNKTFSGTLSSTIVNATTQYNIGGNRVLSVAGGTDNLFAGVGAGQANPTGHYNSFFGRSAGYYNTTGSFNSFFGRSAGLDNTTGYDNSFFGSDAGRVNTTGFNNAFFGLNAGSSNTTGANNTIIGTSANVSSGNLTNATAIGAGAQVSQSNSLVLGNGVNVGIGTSSPQYALHVVGQNVRVEGSSFPRFSLNATGGAVDEKRWQNYATASSLQFTAL